jgi:hypothetical protein
VSDDETRWNASERARYIADVQDLVAAMHPAARCVLLQRLAEWAPELVDQLAAEVLVGEPGRRRRAGRRRLHLVPAPRHESDEPGRHG